MWHFHMCAGRELFHTYLFAGGLNRVIKKSLNILIAVEYKIGLF